VVELRHDVEGFVPVGQMGFDDIMHPGQYFQPGEEVPLKVIKVDPKNKRIVLSISAYLKARGDDAVREFVAAHPARDFVVPATPSGEGDDLDDADLGAGDAVETSSEE
jgi:small subunit ribosomal protein S1